MNPLDNKAVGASPPVIESQLLHSTIFPGLLAATAQTGPGRPGSGASVGSLGHALRRRWRLALGIALAAAGLGIGAVLLFMPLCYTVSAAVQIHSKGDKDIVSASLGTEEPDFGIFKASLAARIKSPQVLLAAVNKVKDQDLHIIRNQLNPVKWLETALKTDFLLGPEVLRITLSGDNPQEIATLANAVIDAYIEEVADGEKRRRANKLQQLEENKRNAERELAQRKALLKKELKRRGLEDIETLKQQYQNEQQRLNLIRKDALMSDLDLVQLQSELKSLLDTEKSLPRRAIPDAQIDEELAKLPQYKVFSDKIAEKFLEIQKLKELLKDWQIPVARLQTQQAALQQEQAKVRETLRPEIEERLRTELLKIVGQDINKTRDKLLSTQQRRETLGKEVVNIEQEVKRLNPASWNMPPEVEDLREKVALQEGVLARLGVIIEGIKLEPTQTARVSLWQRAEAPASFDTSKQLKFGGAAACGLFLLAFISVGYVELRGGRISSPEEVSQGLGMRVVGLLPDVPEAARGGALAGSGKNGSLGETKLTEAIDGVRTFLMYTARTEKIRLVMVTSPGPREGKTTLASQLAASLARAWRNTLLIDGDLRNPAMHKLFGLAQEPGLSEVLRNEAKTADVIKPTSLSRLWLMPAGTWDSHAVQALAQDSVHQIFDALKQQYEFIIVDSCPLLTAADALSLGQSVDGVLFSVLRDVSRFPALQTAQQRFASVDVRTLGAVVIGNQAK